MNYQERSYYLHYWVECWSTSNKWPSKELTTRGTQQISIPSIK